jgi:thioesterase domain-containing protein
MDTDRVREAIARLTPEQRIALEERLRTKLQPGRTRNGIPRRSDRSKYPLSPAQVRLWSLSRLRPDDPVYNIDAVWRLRGSLDAAAVEIALRTLLDRHEALRARIETRSGTPVQSLRTASEFTLETVFLDDARDNILSKEIDRLISEPFDLASDLLFRATLIHVGDDDQLLVVVAHHIVCDGLSMGILASELGPAYAAARSGTEPDLSELELTYSDIAQWQIDVQPGANDLRYWEETLTADLEPLRLPRSRADRGERRMDGATLAFEIDDGLVQRVQEFARARRATAFAVLLAAYQITLNRITGQEKLVLCTPVAGRGRIEMEPLIGYFNNLMPLVGDLGEDPTLEQVVLEAATTISDAFDHSTAAFQDVAGLPAIADKPLTRGLLVLQDGDLPSPDLEGVTATPVEHDSDTSDFELAVFLRPRDGAFRGVVTFRPSLFESDAVASVMDDFTDILARVVDEPTIRLSELPRLGGDPVGPSASERTSTPKSPLEARLHQLWQRAFGRAVGVDDDFFEIGGHSLLAADIIAEVEREFGLVDLPLSTLFEAPTVSRFARWLEGGASEQHWESLVPIKPSGDRPPLYFVHAHGGNVIGYSPLGRHLSEHQPFYGLQAPRGDLGVRRIEDIASAYIGEIKSLQPAGPYVLGGWCLGGDVAFEMGRQLRDSGDEVALVLMVDNPRPEHLDSSGQGSAHFSNRVMSRLAMEWASLAEAPRKGRHLAERVGSLIRKVGVGVERRLTDRDGALPFGLAHSRSYRQEQIAADHSKAYEGYVPEPYDGPVAVFWAELQPRGRNDDPTLGWSHVARGRVDTYQLPGHRMGMLQEPRVARSAAIIEAAIADALGEGSS